MQLDHNQDLPDHDRPDHDHPDHDHVSDQTDDSPQLERHSKKIRQ